MMPAEGFVGVDLVKHKGVKFVTDLRTKWPWKAGTVEEVFSRNLINYLTPKYRIHFANELYRVLKPGGKAQIIVPHWASNRAYGDLDQQWPPVGEEWLFFLNKEWREANAYWAKGYTCDFDFTCGYGMHPAIVPKNDEYRQTAISFWKEAAQETVVSLTKRG
jgi:SAM-dependent methyltransferase